MALVNMEKDLPNSFPKKNIVLRRNHQNIPVCRHFQRGPCRLGDTCKFQHPPRFEKNKHWPSFQICRHFVKGFCRLSNSCKFKHEEGPETQNFSKPPLRLKEKELCRHFARGYCMLDKNCSFRHHYMSSEIPNRRPHTRPENPNHVRGGPIYGFNRRPMPNPGTNTIICRHFARGQCWRGDDCGFLHCKEHEICRHHMRGHCRMGNDCKFKHLGGMNKPSVQMNLHADPASRKMKDAQVVEIHQTNVSFQKNDPLLNEEGGRENPQIVHVEVKEGELNHPATQL